MKKFKIGDVVTYSKGNYHAIGTVVDFTAHNEFLIQVIKDKSNNYYDNQSIIAGAPYLSKLIKPEYFNE